MTVTVLPWIVSPMSGYDQSGTVYESPKSLLSSGTFFADSGCDHLDAGITSVSVYHDRYINGISIQYGSQRG